MLIGPKKWVVEKDFEVLGYRCVIVGQRAGHRCGYIGVPKEHKLYGLNYSEVHDAYNIEVHWGLTYSEGSGNYPVPAEGLWWLGFDCAHVDDKADVELMGQFEDNEKAIAHYLRMEHMFPTGGIIRTEEFVEEQLINLAKQFREIN